MQQLYGNSIGYRIDIRPQQGRKVFALHALPAAEERSYSDRLAQVAGFSLRTGVAAEACQCDKS